MLHVFIYLFCKKKDLQWKLLAYIQCFFSDMQNVISLGCCQRPLVGLLESMWKNIFRRKPTIREFKIERNRILLFIVLIFLRNPLCLLKVPFQVFLLVSGGHNSVSLGDHCHRSLLMCSGTEFLEEENGSFH